MIIKVMNMCNDFGRLSKLFNVDILIVRFVIATVGK